MFHSNIYYQEVSAILFHMSEPTYAVATHVPEAVVNVNAVSATPFVLDWLIVILPPEPIALM
jgi:hypothetical protein